jgi:putative nucleotidyltransferase with HDIG domain
MDNKGTEVIIQVVNMANESKISSIRETIGEILSTVKDASTSAKDLEIIVEKDPPLCAELLKRVNSAYYGFPRTISNIRHAIVFLGFDIVKEMALNQKACDLFTKEDTYEGFSKWSLWKHSVAVAILSKMICRQVFKMPGDELYTSGLLHDIGIILEDQFLQEDFKRALQESRKKKTNLDLAEREILLVDHAKIGNGIMQNWNFPDEMCAAIGFHHCPDLYTGEFKSAVLVLFVSDYICQRENIGYSDASYQTIELFHNCLEELKIEEKSLDMIVAELKEKIQKMEEMRWV